MNSYVSAVQAQMKMSLQVRLFCKDFRDGERLSLDSERQIVLDKSVGIQVGATIYTLIFNRREPLSRMSI